MCSEKSDEKNEKTACRGPEWMQRMFQMMSGCDTGKDGRDCSFMLEVMKGRTCCGPESEKTKGNPNDGKKECC